MFKIMYSAWLAALLLVVACTLSASAQYNIPISVVAEGGAPMSGTSYRCIGTIGQPVIGLTSGASYADLQGFWYGVVTQSSAVPPATESALPKHFALEQNYPNPFNPTTSISFTVPKAAQVTIKVYNIEGQLVETLADQTFSAGFHAVNWTADRHASGVYLIRMSAPNFSEIRRAVLLK